MLASQAEHAGPIPVRCSIQIEIRTNYLVLFYKITLEKVSVNRYNTDMTFLDLLSEKKITVYSLSIDSGVPKTTLTDIASGKADIFECSGKTLLAISKCLNVSIAIDFKIKCLRNII